jgi:hypothetical protein
MGAVWWILGLRLRFVRPYRLRPDLLDAVIFVPAETVACWHRHSIVAF